MPSSLEVAVGLYISLVDAAKAGIMATRLNIPTMLRLLYRVATALIRYQDDGCGSMMSPLSRATLPSSLMLGSNLAE